MSYPGTLTVAYPEKLSRLTTFFRFLTIIPQLIVFVLVSIAAEVILILAWFAILFTGRYPEVLFNFITWWLRWATRFTAYFYLLTDKYPPFSGRIELDYPVALNVETPGELSRLTTFLRFPVIPTLSWSTGNNGSGWKWDWSFATGWPMTIPHTIVLFFLGIVAVIILILAWFAIIFTGRYPHVFFDYITWFFRWGVRVNSYAVLVTDKYPPFSGSEEA